jgi:solute carrier family 12 sodium/potassium/chloride transporter 2
LDRHHVSERPNRGTDAAPHGHGFGTSPVFLASISTILGAVMFLRFGYAVGHAGLLGAIVIILLGHLVTVPTALAIAEIATNRRVEGGGEYFIISRSFGTTIGGAIGISLYMSQAISVAFYMIAFAEAFQPLAPWLEATVGVDFDPRFVSLPATVALVAVVLEKGAGMGVKALWIVASILGLSLAMFFLGSAPEGIRPESLSVFSDLDPPDPFMLVFAIVFPAFTGMTAGVGLSGDLKEPRRSIPLGIISATMVGMIVYVLLAAKLAASADSVALSEDYLIMSRIAVWGPIIPIGLACATVSSAIGSILVAPRTLQALGADAVVPQPRLNNFLAAGTGEANEPRNATLVTFRCSSW